MNLKTVAEDVSSDLPTMWDNICLEGVACPAIHLMVDVNAERRDGSTALVLASFKGHLEVVAELLNHVDIDVNAVNRNGATALISASGCGHFEIVVELLNFASVNGKIDNHDCNTQPSLASGNVGDADSFGWDLMGSDSNDAKTRKDGGNSDLNTSGVRICSKDPIQSVTQRKVNVNATNDEDATALIAASSSGHSKIVHELLSCKDVDVNAENLAGDTCLTVATRHGHSEVVLELQKHNVDVCE